MMSDHRPVWVEHMSRDAAASKAFYAGLFGWSLLTNEDPQYGGYAMAQIDGRDVAGFGSQMDPAMPGANWNLYVGTADAAASVAAATAAGGTVAVPPFTVGTMGTAAFIADPSGAVLGLWQPADMSGVRYQGPNGFAWAELNARGVERAIRFYESAFGWSHRTSDMGDGTLYTEFRDGEESLAGALEMPAQVPPQVPSHWLAYFAVEDITGTHDAAVRAGATSMVPPMAFPGGTFAVLGDPQGGSFGLLRMAD